MMEEPSSNPSVILAKKLSASDKIVDEYLSKKNGGVLVENIGKELFINYEDIFGWKQYIAINHGKTIHDFVKNKVRYKSITIDLKKLYDYEENDAKKWYTETEHEKIEKHTLTNLFYDNPDKTLNHIQACLEELKEPYNTTTDKPIEIHVTNVEMPVDIRDIRIDNVDRLYSINCSISKIGNVRPVLVVGVYECIRCKELIEVPQIIGEAEIHPAYCKCDSEKKGVFRLVQKESKYIDYQLSRLSENVDACTNGEQPQIIDARLINDLCGNLVPGERVIIYGIPRVIIKRDGRGVAKTNRDLIIQILGYKKEDKSTFIITSEDEAEIRDLASKPDIKNLIVDSIASSVYGQEDLKLAIALTLVGGVRKRFPDGSIQRGDSHLLIVGDPGVAKSVILKAAGRLLVRGMVLSGKGASGVGLTAAAVKDNFGGDKWSIEAGALPLSNGGAVILDEFDKLSENDRDCLHGALEDQEIEIVKAGLRARLRTQCKLITAANPIYGRFDEHQDLPSQINMKPSLMSRFDIIYILRDKVDPENDSRIANSIVAAHAYGGRIEKYRSEGISHELVPFDNDEKFLMPKIREELLKKYLHYARTNITPIFERDDGSYQYLVDVYTKLRSGSTDMMITARQLGGLIRLSEASARLRLSNTISKEDVDDAVKLYLTSIKEAAKSDGTANITNLMVDVSSSQSERMKAIVEYLKKNDNVDGVNRKNVVSALSLIGYDDSSIYRSINQLKNTRKIMELPNGNLKYLN
jgi:replicative DNA helicase Mcm